jgi:hypothetical protein
MTMITYVLFIQFAEDPPRVAVFGTLDEAEAHLDGFEVSLFDPPLNEDLDPSLLRAHIFECKSDDWGTEINIEERRGNMPWPRL